VDRKQSSPASERMLISAEELNFDFHNFFMAQRRLGRGERKVFCRRRRLRRKSFGSTFASRPSVCR